MANSKLTEVHSIRFTSDQNKALDMLISKGFNRNKFVRLEVDDFYEVERVFFNVKELNMTYYVMSI